MVVVVAAAEVLKCVVRSHGGNSAIVESFRADKISPGPAGND